MSALRIRPRGSPIRRTRAVIAAYEKMLESKMTILKTVRKNHRKHFMELDREIEDLRRRIATVQTRNRMLLNKEFPEWAEHNLAKRIQEQEQEQAKAAAALEQQKKQQDHTPLPPAKPRLGDQLLSLGYVSEQQLEEAMELQTQFGGRLGDILIELGYVTAEQLLPLISESQVKLRLGEMLLQNGYITRQQLEKALAFQQKSGGLLGDVLLSLRFIEPEDLYRAIATQNQIGRIGEEHSVQDHVKLAKEVAREFGVIIIHQYDNRYLVAVNEPLGDERKKQLEKRLEMPIEQVLASKNEMELFWTNVYGDEMLHDSIFKLATDQPENSANVTFTRGQIITAAITVFTLMLLSVFWPMTTLITINIVVQIFYFLMTTFRFLIILYGSRAGAQYRFTDEEIAEIDERDLPVYTILVPMYKESSVIPHLLNNLEKLDYPKAKLDVRLLIETDDIEAQEMLEHMRLPSYYTVIVVPDSLPKTKPKACNYGLIRARGEYVVIFDAEDRPDPDQLKKVYLTFKQCSEDTICVQAKLNYFNSEQNILTRWFTQEYSMWFELLLPGIMKLNIPIPLGGTSNHFKTEVLKQLNAWDPYNVTEDADLGIRLYKEGYKTAIVDSRTWEEANSKFGNWIRQRSRWIKGYMQTWLVHMRNPFKLWKEIGPRGFMGFQVMVLATPIIPLLNPIFWMFLVLWYVWEMGFIPQIFPGVIYYIAAIELYIANFFFIYANIVGVYWVINDMEKKEEQFISHRIVKYALLTPLYWMMMSIAAVKAAWQLITKPFYWEKTDHGLDQNQKLGSEQQQHSA